MKKVLTLLCVIFCSNIYAQDFGFGFGDEDAGSSGSAGKPFSVSISGEASAELLGYVHDFSEGADHTGLGDVFSGRLNFSAGTKFADGVINLKLQPTQPVVAIDEAYVRAFFGSFEVEGGLRKLTWGKADSFGPLDVVNPLDYSELTDLSDIMKLKIARPLIHASYRVGSFTKIEGLFVPTFEPLRYAEEGRWVPAQMKQIDEFRAFAEGFNIDVPVYKPDISKVEYAQAGARLTTTIGSADLGLQYYYGRITKPAFSVDFSPAALQSTAIHFNYNPYHQIGVDWAQVLFGFNVRAEFAANITYDFKGGDGSVYNPALAWSLGFDRDLIEGINLNFQCNETIRLMNNKTGSADPMDVLSGKYDIEGDLPLTTTQIISYVSKKFLRDELETKVAVMWEIEDKDCLIIPSFIWTRDTVALELSAGIFCGDEAGQFGQFWKNSFVKTVLTYSF